MRRAFADFSPAVPAAFAAGLGVSLWIFLLPAGVVQKGPTAALPAFGSAAGRVVADLPVAVAGRASEARTAPSAHSKLVVALRPPATKARRVQHRARTVVVRRVPAAPVQAVAPAAPKAPVTKSQLFSMPPKAKGKARGHAPKPKAETQTPHPPGHGKALGRSNDNEDRLPPGLAKKASPASAPGLSPPPKGNGRKEGRKGNGGGNADKGNAGGNGRKLGWEKK